MNTSADALERDIRNTQEMIDTTQAAMTEKFQMLENQVRGNVESAQNAVGEIVTTVKDAITDTAETVKHTFDISYHAQQHPWLLFGLFVAGGYLYGMRGKIPQTTAMPYLDVEHYRTEDRHGEIGNQFRNEFGSLRGAITGAVITALFELAKRALTSYRSAAPSRR
jgi:hypothetical protein